MLLNSGRVTWSMLLTLAISFAALHGQETARGPVDFATEIKPLFEQYCVHCHGPNRVEGFRIDVRDEAMNYIEPGDPSGSHLYELLITDDETELMPPPAEGTPLSREQIRLVRNWIRQGANWPDDVQIVDPADLEKPKDNPDAPLSWKLWLASGAFHPAAAHLPIGLLMGAGLFALLSLRGSFVMSDCAYYCLWLGAITAVIASATGWSYAISTSRGAEIAELFNPAVKIFWHRLLGLIVSLLALLLAFVAAAARARDPDNGLWWKLGTMLIAAGVGLVGYTGGKLHYGDKHYRQLNQIIDSWTGWNWAGDAPPADGKAAPPNEESGTGRASSEGGGNRN